MGHNRTENTDGDQMCGMTMMALGRLSTYVLDVCVDYTGLGQSSWILVGSVKKKKLG